MCMFVYSIVSFSWRTSRCVCLFTVNILYHSVGEHLDVYVCLQLTYILYHSVGEHLDVYVCLQLTHCIIQLENI